MANKRRFKKYYNREVPVYYAEYWYQGERFGLAKMTNNLVYFNPLFIYEKGRATDIYYDINNPEARVDWLVDDFVKQPEKFKTLTCEYEKECKELLKFIKNTKIKDLLKIFDLHVSVWAKFAIIMILGEWLYEEELAELKPFVCDARKRTENFEYLLAESYVELISRSIPKRYKNFLEFLTFEEIVDQKKISLEELKKREKGYMFFEGRVYPDISIEELERIENILVVQADQKRYKGLTKIRGQVARKGKVSGRVKVVFVFNQLNKVKRGDILVAPMSTPEYLSAMKRAVAFVTDEGGITCHAAIVAREMKKPCVIGTKIATQVLRDGDLVEVDADRGVVRKIAD